MGWLDAGFSVCQEELFQPLVPKADDHVLSVCKRLTLSQDRALKSGQQLLTAF
jgi:hypothetical protein